MFCACHARHACQGFYLGSCLGQTWIVPESQTLPRLAVPSCADFAGPSPVQKCPGVAWVRHLVAVSGLGPIWGGL